MSVTIYQPAIHRRPRTPGSVDRMSPIPQVTQGNKVTGSGNGVSNFSFSHTVQSTYENRILLVFLVGGATGTISTFTYNGVAMTYGVTVTSSNAFATVYYMINPPTGANTVYADTAAGWWMGYMSIDFYNVHQSTTPTFDSGSGSGQGTLDATFTLSQGDAMAGALAYWDNGADATDGATGQIALLNEYVDGAWKNRGAKNSGSGSTVISWSNLNNDAGLVGIRMFHV